MLRKLPVILLMVFCLGLPVHSNESIVDALTAVSQELEIASALLKQGLTKVETSFEQWEITSQKVETALMKAEKALKQAEAGLETSEKGLSDLRQQIKSLEQSFYDYKMLVNKQQKRQKVLRKILIALIVAAGIWAIAK